MQDELVMMVQQHWCTLHMSAGIELWKWRRLQIKWNVSRHVPLQFVNKNLAKHTSDTVTIPANNKVEDTSFLLNK